MVAGKNRMFRTSSGKLITTKDAQMAGVSTNVKELSSEDIDKLISAHNQRTGGDVSRNDIVIDGKRNVPPSAQKAIESLQSTTNKVISLRNRANKIAKENNLNPISNEEKSLFKRMIEKGDIEGAMNQTTMLLNTMKKDFDKYAEKVGASNVTSLADKKKQSQASKMLDARLKRDDIQGAINQNIAEAESLKKFAKESLAKIEANNQVIIDTAQKALGKYPLLGEKKRQGTKSKTSSGNQYDTASQFAKESLAKIEKDQKKISRTAKKALDKNPLL